jgi:hypothetical protein
LYVLEDLLDHKPGPVTGQSFKNLQNNAMITDNAFSDGLFNVGVGIILKPE